MIRKKYQQEETVVIITCENEKYYRLIIEEIDLNRKYLKEYIEKKPFFRTTYKVMDMDPSAPLIVQEMQKKSSYYPVGPMASVAGAVAWFSLKKAVELGAKHVVIDNGGDIGYYIQEPITIGLYTGNSPFRNIGFGIENLNSFGAVATSSGKIGHSFSFGKAHAATVFADDLIIADAAATALGNCVRERDKSALENILDSFSIEYIDGIAVIIDDLMGVRGDIPEMVKADFDMSLIAY